MEISIELERCDKLAPPPPPDPPPPQPPQASSSKLEAKMRGQGDQRVRTPKVRAKMVAKKKRDTSASAECDEVDAYGHRLSAKSKETIMKLKKIDDPFAPDIQQVMDDVCENIQKEGHQMDLAEAALLISGCTKVYCAQVDDAYAYVVAACNRISGGKTIIPIKGRKRKTNEENREGCEEKKEKLGEDGQPLEPEGSSETVVAAEEGQVACSQADKDGCPDDNGDSGIFEGSMVDGDNKENGEAPEAVADAAGEAAGEQVENAEKPADGQEAGAEEKKDGEKDGDEVKEPTVEEVQQLQSEILLDIPTRCTRRQSERLRNILNLEKVNDREYKLKKRKFDDDPPQLISCVEEWKELMEYEKLNGDIDYDEIMPPVLEVQVGRKRKKVVINNNDDTQEGCEACHGDDLPCNSSAGACDENKEKSEAEKMASALALAMSSSSLSGGEDGSHQYETLDHLPDDVQESFHALIQEMHKLPFDYGLMQQDMFKAYQQKFLQAVSLLSQNSVLVKKKDEDKDEKGNPECGSSAGTDTQSATLDTTVPLANSQILNDSQMSETDQTISSINELLSQVRLQATEEYRKGRQSKADAEVPVSQMIATLKKIICSRYKKWHVRTDSDKGVFQRIKEFEDKVKAVLIREAEQGLFDVKKYEMEVMDVTFKESQDGETDDIFACPLSPIAPGTSASALLPPEGAQSPRPENWPLVHPASRRSSIAGSIDGSSSWIRLYDIFSHMKKIDNSETCRHFYAVLALLSHKNLNVNYDTLFSKESAKLITKLVKTRDESLAQKYPVGAKIMTSRCPDMDEEEVLLAPVFNTETFQQFLQFPENHDGYLSSSGYQSDGQGSGGSSSGGPVPGPSTSHHHSSSATPTPKTIQEVLNEFVVDPGESYPDDYFQMKSNRGRKKY